MDRTQAIVIALLVLGFIVVGVLLAQRPGEDPAAAFTAAKPFLARGDTREGHKPILTDRPPSAMTKAGDGAKAEGALETVAGDPPKRNEPVSSESPAHEALNALNPGEAIEEVLTELGGLAELEKASDLYATLGTLYSQLDPPDTQKALDAFAAAAQTAATPEQQLKAAVQEAQILLREKHDGAAKQRLKQVAGLSALPSVEGLRLALVEADVTAADDPVAGETAYRALLDRAAAEIPNLGDGALDVYRLAGLRLARYYHATGQTEKAAALAIEVKQTAAQSEER